MSIRSASPRSPVFLVAPFSCSVSLRRILYLGTQYLVPHYSVGFEAAEIGEWVLCPRYRQCIILGDASKARSKRRVPLRQREEVQKVLRPRFRASRKAAPPRRRAFRDSLGRVHPAP